ncbi:MAG TPA: tetratricopeptide repeat protein [Smithella sp.]|jgi:tetratricopeptide (TPR) repeat protein|nr:tetratricopeptide repeat protein [Smithella sp.]HOG10448.1 tetratricopeptide repeat protein [Smithella sp.]HOS14676.1 tetratricopeptide repeat protein [Smithella sp.]HPL48390.1 tetratricopeptide repeat protein [Smithella sp.]HQN70507.1 tetratricopeptide repeat protein [Smithella sp.]
MENSRFDKKQNLLLRKAEAFLREGNFGEALLIAENHLLDCPADADALGICCEALINMGRLEDMRNILLQTEECISALNLVCERSGDACREKGFHQEAAACYERFISLRPETEKASEIIEKMTLLDQEDHPTVPEKGKRNIPAQDFFTVTLAQLYIDQGHLQNAKTILDEILKKDPDNRQALSMLNNLISAPAASGTVNGNTKKNDELIKILSSWLKNIERLKMNAA